MTDVFIIPKFVTDFLIVAFLPLTKKNVVKKHTYTQILWSV